MAETHGLLVIERILRDRDGVWRQIADDRGLKSLSGQMLASSAIALAVFGAVLGASSGWLQAISSAVKLPLLFLITLAICLPTLYLFNLVFGARLSVRQALALVSVSITVISMLSVAFAPITLFFLITAPQYSFFKLLNVAILTLTGVGGLRFLISGMRALNALNERRALDAVAKRPAAAGAVQTAEPPKELATVGAPQSAVVAAPQPTATVSQAVPNGQPPYPTPVTWPGQQYGYPPPPAPLPQRPPAKPAARSGSMGLLYMWVVVFGFVGTQLAWTLRPFVGSPGEKFEVFRAIEGNFYVDIVRTIALLF
ncbi:MAG TPA: hypothetical protein VGR21_09385 [Cryptosporangiaceae bacterium]|nr:hypothetical protein [Cryptosporangiaceae bacterium]